MVLTRRGFIGTISALAAGLVTGLWPKGRSTKTPWPYVIRDRWFEGTVCPVVGTVYEECRFTNVKLGRGPRSVKFVRCHIEGKDINDFFGKGCEFVDCCFKSDSAITISRDDVFVQGNTVISPMFEVGPGENVTLLDNHLVRSRS